MRAWVLILAPVLLCAACGGETAPPPLIPAKTVVLTFDDSEVSQLENVVPILEELRFGATFFVTHRFREEVGTGFLDWDGMAEFQRHGFEVGNHSLAHAGFNIPACARNLPLDTSIMEYQLGLVGVPKPVSFAWPGDAFGPQAVEHLRRLGYKFARRGRSPEVHPGTDPVPGPAYDPRVNSPLLVPTCVAAGPDWSVSDLRGALALAVEGHAVVVQFHGVPDALNPDVGVTPEIFRQWMELLKREGYRAVALRDLERYVNWSSPPKDPLLAMTLPDPATNPPLREIGGR